MLFRKWSSQICETPVRHLKSGCASYDAGGLECWRIGLRSGVISVWKFGCTAEGRIHRLLGCMGSKGETWGGVPSQLGGDWGAGGPFPEKKWMFPLKWHVLVNSEWQFFVRALASHCHASNLVLQILKQDEIRRWQFAFTFHHSNFWGTRPTSSFPSWSGTILLNHGRREASNGVYLAVYTIGRLGHLLVQCASDPAIITSRQPTSINHWPEIRCQLYAKRYSTVPCHVHQQCLSK